MAKEDLELGKEVVGKFIQECSQLVSRAINTQIITSDQVTMICCAFIELASVPLVLRYGKDRVKQEVLGIVDDIDKDIPTNSWNLPRESRHDS